MNNELALSEKALSRFAKEIVESIPDEAITKWGGLFIVSGFFFLAWNQYLDCQKAKTAMEHGYDYKSSPFSTTITKPEATVS